MGVAMRELYSSPNGDRWYLARNVDSGQIFIRPIDGSKWRIWPGDLAATLGWTSEAEIETLPIDDKFCSHVLIERSKGSRVRAIDARNELAIEDLREFLRDG